MKREKSLKKEILVILISFSIFVAISVGLIAMVNFYYSKLNIIEHNQKQILFQIESEIEKFLLKIDKISLYIKNNYDENSDLIKNIVDTNTNISSILVLSKDGIIEDFYATTNLNIRIDKAIKDQAEEIFNELGLNMTTAVNMFLRTAIREHGIPFELKLEVPNDTTAAAIEEGRKMMKDPSAPRYSSMDALKAALDVWNTTFSLPISLKRIWSLPKSKIKILISCLR